VLRQYESVRPSPGITGDEKCISTSGDADVAKSRMMEGLIEIHRILYRGSSVDAPAGWEERSEEVRNVVDRWFEGDCSEFPLHSLSSLGAEVEVCDSL
jgi:hypothetical protein